MTISAKLPSVLQQPHGNSLSIERVLKSAIHLLENDCQETHQDQLSVCLEDLETMLKCIDR